MIGTGLTAVYFLLLVNRTFGRLSEQVLNLPMNGLTAPSLILLPIVILGLQAGWMVR